MLDVLQTSVVFASLGLASTPTLGLQFSCREELLKYSLCVPQGPSLHLPPIKVERIPPDYIRIFLFHLLLLLFPLRLLLFILVYLRLQLTDSFVLVLLLLLLLLIFLLPPSPSLYPSPTPSSHRTYPGVFVAPAQGQLCVSGKVLAKSRIRLNFPKFLFEVPGNPGQQDDQIRATYNLLPAPS